MWRFAVGRVTGTAHLKSDLPCQDRCLCHLLPDGTFVAAVADGAGSAKMAELGAEIATDTVISSVKAAVEDGHTDLVGVLRQAAEKAREAVIAAAREHGVPPRDLASTLLATILTSEDGVGAALQIGDGVIVVSDDGGGWNWVFWPQHGEYANTTRFLTDDDALDHLQAEVVAAPVADVAMMSDGLERLALNLAEKTAHALFFNGLFTPLHQTGGSGEMTELSAALVCFLGSPRVVERTDDDLALVVATCRTVTV